MNLKIIIMLIGLGGCFAGQSWAQEGGQGPVHLTLKEALENANTINLQVMMANARLEQAIARISEAQSDLLPHVDGLLSGGRQTADLRSEGILFPGLEPHVGPFNTFDARPRLTMALFDPSAFERFRSAKKGENLSEAELEKTREDVLALVADLFVDAERKQQTVGLMKTLLDRDRMSYDLGEAGLVQGTGTSLDSKRFKSELAETKSLYVQAQQQSQDASVDLEAALQIPLDRSLVLVDDKGFIKRLENNATVNFNNAANADVALASSQLEARRADQKTAYADFLPKVSGNADYGRSGESPSNGSNTYTVGVAVSVPFWDGGSQQAKLKEVKGEIKEDQENLQDASQQEQVNIAKARVEITEADDLRQAKVLKQETFQRALRIALHAQAIGTDTVFQVMQAKADLATAEDEYNEAQAAWVMARIDLLHAQGRLRGLIK